MRRGVGMRRGAGMRMLVIGMQNGYLIYTKQGTHGPVSCRTYQCCTHVGYSGSMMDWQYHTHHRSREDLQLEPLSASRNLKCHCNRKNLLLSLTQTCSVGNLLLSLTQTCMQCGNQTTHQSTYLGTVSRFCHVLFSGLQERSRGVAKVLAAPPDLATAPPTTQIRPVLAEQTLE